MTPCQRDPNEATTEVTVPFDCFSTAETVRLCRKTWWRKFVAWLRRKRCPCCQRPRDEVKRRRLNTYYEDDDSNHLTSCETCYEDTRAHCDEMWADYYGGRL